MDFQKVISTLAIRVAQLETDKAILQVQLEEAESELEIIKSKEVNHNDL